MDNEVLEFPTLPEVDTLAVPRVAYEDLKKDELIKVLESKDKSLEHYELLQEENKKEINRMNYYYVNRIKELQSIIAYYERKLNVLKDIITMENGGEKNA